MRKRPGRSPEYKFALLRIRLIFRAFPADIGMQVSSVIRTGPATRCSESFVTSRQSLTLSSRVERRFSDHRKVKTTIIPASGGGSENCVTISEELIIRNNCSRSGRLERFKSNLEDAKFNSRCFELKINYVRTSESLLLLLLIL